MSSRGHVDAVGVPGALLVFVRRGQHRVVPSRRTASPGAPPLRFLGPRMVASAAAQKLKPRSSTCCGWISNVGTTVSIGDQGLKLAALLSSWHGGAAASWPASHGGIEGRPILCELMAVGRSSGPVHKGTRPGTASAGNAVRSTGACPPRCSPDATGRHHRRSTQLTITDSIDVTTGLMV